MKKYSVLTLISLFFSTACLSQGAKSVYVELAGPGLASANFDMRFGNKEDGLGFRAGIGGFSVSDSYSDGSSKTSVITIPLGLTYLIGKDKKNYFELGGGITPVFPLIKKHMMDFQTRISLTALSAIFILVIAFSLQMVVFYSGQL